MILLWYHCESLHFFVQKCQSQTGMERHESESIIINMINKSLGGGELSVMLAIFLKHCCWHPLLTLNSCQADRVQSVFCYKLLQRVLLGSWSDSKWENHLGCVLSCWATLPFSLCLSFTAWLTLAPCPSLALTHCNETQLLLRGKKRGRDGQDKETCAGKPRWRGISEPMFLSHSAPLTHSKSHTFTHV